MRELWKDKNARGTLIFDLVCALPLAAIPSPWWMRVIAVAWGVVILLFVFGAAYFAGQSFVYRKVNNEMSEMRETVSDITTTYRQRIAELPIAQFPPPRHYH